MCAVALLVSLPPTTVLITTLAALPLAYFIVTPPAPPHAVVFHRLPLPSLSSHCFTPLSAHCSPLLTPRVRESPLHRECNSTPNHTTNHCHCIALPSCVVTLSCCSPAALPLLPLHSTRCLSTLRVASPLYALPLRSTYVFSLLSLHSTGCLSRLSPRYLPGVN